MKEQKILFATLLLLIAGFLASSFSATGYSSYEQPQYNPYEDEWAFRSLPSDSRCSLFGDEDGNGEVNPSDVFKLNNYLRDGANLACPHDINGDGALTLADVDALEEYVLTRTHRGHEDRECPRRVSQQGDWLVTQEPDGFKCHTYSTWNPQQRYIPSQGPTQNYK